MGVPFYCGTVDEDDIIRSLLRFEEFNKFYYNEYKPRKAHIALNWWIYPFLLEKGYYAMTAVDNETGIDSIWLQRLPVTLTDAYLAAHELGHVIRKVDNLSLLIVEEDLNYVDVAGYIKSIMEDRVIDKMLREKYNFILVDHYIDVMTNVMKFLDISIVVTGVNRIKMPLVHADYLLRWSLIDDDESFKREFDKYKRLMNENYQSIAEEGEDIAREAMKIGFETRDNQKQIFDYIINKYTLAEVLSVK